MTKKQMLDVLDAVAQLKSEGYAVVVFCPGELEGATPKKLEASLVKFGRIVISDLIDGPEEGIQYH
jgi:hypothetical protein